MKKLLKYLLYVLPLVLYFSYFPVIGIGSNESMNFELSLPLIWLVVFDVVGLVVLAQQHQLFGWLKGRRWVWLLFPAWLSLSVIWSLNPLRGVLTVGILWLLYFAGYVMWSVRDLFDDEFRAKWWRWFIGSALFACGWCVVQCMLDLVGVSQDYSLMCDGCTYYMFGFPHPNGFAIEPQFMGNLLLAPAMVAMYIVIKGDCNSTFRGRVVRARRPKVVRRVSPRCETQAFRLLGSYDGRYGARALILGRNLRKPLKVLLPIAFTVTLFLTFSRGAIYAFVVGLLFLSGFVVFAERKRERLKVLKRVGMAWGLVVLSFVVVLNVQGLMASVGPTSDTYFDGVSKVLNHLSLGVIDIDGEKDAEKGGEAGNTEGELREDEFVLVEKSVENSEEKVVENSESEEPVFSGYVAESTDTRVRLSGAAVEVWSQSASNALLGVGLGGAGFALYNNGLSPAPKEIVQNEYASLLLETGLVGVSLFVLTLVLIVRVVWKKNFKSMVLSLLVAYGVSLVFFSGLPNALQIILVPLVMITLL